jgi:hypothetical protein
MLPDFHTKKCKFRFILAGLGMDTFGAFGVIIVIGVYWLFGIFLHFWVHLYHFVFSAKKNQIFKDADCLLAAKVLKQSRFMYATSDTISFYDTFLFTLSLNGSSV